MLAQPAARELAQVDGADDQKGLLDLRHPLRVATEGHSSLRPPAERRSATDSEVGEDVRWWRNSLAAEPRDCNNEACGWGRCVFSLAELPPLHHVAPMAESAVLALLASLSFDRVSLCSLLQ